MRKKKSLSFCLLILLTFSFSSSAQQLKTITGKVTDTSNVALQSVSVIVKNKSAATETQKDGTFSVKASDEDTLVFSHIGFADKHVYVGSKSTIDVVLSEGISDLSNVTVTVVSIGYGTLNKKEVSSAVTHISGKELLSVGGNGALMSLQGKVAGLTVSNTFTADPNSTPTIQLRGVSSRNAGLEPLYVINGIPGGNINNINQNDIESIDVLKGGAASAIYGTRGSNGVIIITTKKGSSEPRLFYDGYIGLDFITNKLKVLSRDEFVAHKERGNDFGHNTDWLKQVSRDPAISTKHTLQFSGGGVKTNYMVSADYRRAEGIDLRATKEEYGARLNINHTAANNLYTASINIAPRYYKVNHAYMEGFNYALTLNPTMSPYDSLGRYAYIRTGFFANNPIEEAKAILKQQDAKLIDMSGSFKLNITKTLSTTVTVGETGFSYRNYDFTPSTITYKQKSNGGNGRSTAQQKQEDTDQKNFEWIGNYDVNISKHAFKLAGGYSYQYSTYSQFSAGNEGFPSDVLTYNNMEAGWWDAETGIKGVSSSKNSSKLISFFGRVNYDFNKKYYLSASLRHEGSSKFGKSNKWGNFPAVAVAWRLTQEKFMQNIPWLNDLKLRADYGTTGNQDFGNYKSLNTYGGYGYYIYNGTTYQVWGPNQNANYNLRWEKAINFNAGVDFDLFQSLLSGSINYYQRTNKDLLGDYNVPNPPNIRQQTYANVGTMKNAGLEIQLNANVVRHKDFNYNISFAGATNSNKFISFSNEIYKGQKYVDVVGMPGPGTPGNVQRIEEGRRVGSFYTWRSAGVDSTGALLVYTKDGKTIRGDKATNDDKQYTGNGLPQFTASMGHYFKYRNWDAGVFLRGVFGYKIFNTFAFKLGTPATQQNANVLTTAYDGGKYSKLTNGATYATLSDYFLESGNFVKIDNMSVGYTCRFSQSIKIRSARVYATARNLHCFTKYKGGDPDLVPINGLYPGVNNRLNYYPSSLQLLFGLQVNF
ncbi:SusC/RagA family TonB-linked outer membrane protein [Danxiaibacter flavus]|uniref:SusC/RagA family TonB-linked outer membrane protein n=1 Tax=Danxiaibacter flavus TaxID=3049108 RepID=A0ABV3ZD09_9BACT|nr:SusC/RagA family TonB-linked outer membrane protein [Chitinophagaceae bacterium DXS]